MLTFTQILVIVLVGLASGWLASVFRKTRRPSLPVYLVAGMIGALIGGPLLGLLGLRAVNLTGTVVAALLGALLAVYPLRFVK